VRNLLVLFHGFRGGHQDLLNTRNLLAELTFRTAKVNRQNACPNLFLNPKAQIVPRKTGTSGKELSRFGHSASTHTLIIQEETLFFIARTEIPTANAALSVSLPLGNERPFGPLGAAVPPIPLKQERFFQ
jgi:hypothetical protein